MGPPSRNRSLRCSAPPVAIPSRGDGSLSACAVASLRRASSEARVGWRGFAKPLPPSRVNLDGAPLPKPLPAVLRTSGRDPIAGRWVPVGLRRRFAPAGLLGGKGWLEGGCKTPRPSRVNLDGAPLPKPLPAVLRTSGRAPIAGRWVPVGLRRRFAPAGLLGGKGWLEGFRKTPPPIESESRWGPPPETAPCGAPHLRSRSHRGAMGPCRPAPSLRSGGPPRRQG